MCIIIIKLIPKHASLPTFGKATVLGSRDQMCIHPEVSKETNNSTKTLMCQMRVKARTCFYHSQVNNSKPYYKYKPFCLVNYNFHGSNIYYITHDLYTYYKLEYTLAFYRNICLSWIFLSLFFNISDFWPFPN